MIIPEWASVNEQRNQIKLVGTSGILRSRSKFEVPTCSLQLASPLSFVSSRVIQLSSLFSYFDFVLRTFHTSTPYSILNTPYSILVRARVLVQYSSKIYYLLRVSTRIRYWALAEA